MKRVNVFIMCLFLVSVATAISFGKLMTDTGTFLIALLFFWIFSTLYSHLSVIVNKGKIRMDYSISYGLAISLLAGPLGAFIFEGVQRFIVYLIRKMTKTADKEEFIHTFYNIGAFALNNSIAYFLFIWLSPALEHLPLNLGFWLLIMLIVSIVSLLSDCYLITVFSLSGEMKSIKEAFEFIKTRNLFDMGKTAFSNGLLFVFLNEQRWEMLFALFFLNYLVSRSFFEKTNLLQHKMERDKFKEMAYTDFLTEVHNRAFMDHIMNELDQSVEELGIVVCDIDNFKRINDSYNHAVGDRVIQQFAATLRQHLRDEDYLFRSGGEEFTIFLRHRSYDECLVLVEQIRSSVACQPAEAEFKGQPIFIAYTATFGLYYHQTDQLIDMKSAYVSADDLLLFTKDRGKNGFSAKNGKDAVQEPFL
ncbi:GGDEF domain-containing protein [Virgibacillus halophilus]|uniref:GGDEF domain-containing protein n=1 Tax=Tigheibacillus halophilus TaxID=361280 RepID=UPI00362AF401